MKVSIAAPTFALLLASILVPLKLQATPIGTVIVNPGNSVIPGLTGVPAGTLLATTTARWTSSLGTSSGIMVTAVFMEPGGTLDFYYQVKANLTAPNCGSSVGQPPCDPIAREASFSFAGYLTSVGFRTDGASLPGSFFIDGTVSPLIADRNAVGDVVGFSFSPPDSAKIQPGQASLVLVIGTNAMSFAPGNVSLFDGGVTTVSSWEPSGPTSTPEPSSLLLLGFGIATLAGLRLRITAVNVEKKTTISL
jgi:hypothetical protein